MYGMIIDMAHHETDLLARLWDETSAMPFPADWYHREPGGHCLVTLHATLAGCAAAVLDGPLDPAHLRHLRQRATTLRQLLPVFAEDAYAARYFGALHRMAALAEEIASGDGAGGGISLGEGAVFGRAAGEG